MDEVCFEQGGAVVFMRKDVQREARDGKVKSMIRRLAKLGFAFGLLTHFALGQTPGLGTGTIQAVVFTADAGGERSVLAAAKISLDGATHIKTQSNNQFGPTSTFSVDQNETSWLVGDKWTVSKCLTFDLGLRFDRVEGRGRNFECGPTPLCMR